MKIARNLLVCAAYVISESTVCTLGANGAPMAGILIAWMNGLLIMMTVLLGVDMFALDDDVSLSLFAGNL